MGKHLASCGILGSLGGRVGTCYAHTPRQAWGMVQEPWFRFRNAECEAECLAAWKAGAPGGKYFSAAPDEETPTVGHSERIDDREVLSCPLAVWERDGQSSGARHLQRYSGTDYCRWYYTKGDGWWNPYGQLLKLTDAGRKALETPND